MAKSNKKSPVKLTRVEDGIILFFLHRFLVDEDEVIILSLHEIAKIIGRNVKSVFMNIQSLKEKGLVTFRKQSNCIHVKLNTERNEITSRLSILAMSGDYTLSNLELIKDLKKIYSLLTDELDEAKEKLLHIINLNIEIEQSFSQLSEKDIDSLVHSILYERTFSNISKPLDKLVHDELLAFRRKISFREDIKEEINEEELDSFDSLDNVLPPKEELAFFRALYDERMGNLDEEG